MKKYDKKGAVIGGSTLIGLGVGFAFLQTSVFLFLMSLMVGIGIGVVLSAFVGKK